MIKLSALLALISWIITVALYIKITRIGKEFKKLEEWVNEQTKID